ncbi:MAG: hypothetical protein ABMA64_15160, partial [Myxococcota bacterium]
LALAGGMTVLLGMTLGVVVWVVSRTPSRPVAPPPEPAPIEAPAPVAAPPAPEPEPQPAPPPAPAPQPSAGGGCPTEGGDPLGWVRAPDVFVKSAGTVWTLREPRKVVATVPNGPVVCELPAGAQVRVPRGPVTPVGEGKYLQVSPRDLKPNPSSPAEEPQGEVAADRCTGKAGERIGWFFTKLRDRSDSAPYRGGTWEITYARYVYDDVPRRGSDGAVVCALPKDSSLDVKQDPVRGSGGYWVPLVAGSLHR